MTYALKLGLSSLWQNKKRNLATALIVGVSYLVLILILGYATRVERYYRVSTVYLQQKGHIAFFKERGLRQHLVKPSKYSLSSQEEQQLLGAIAAMPQFDFAARYLIGAGLISNGCKSFVFVGKGVDPKAEERINRHPVLRQVMPQFSLLYQGEPLWRSPVIEQLSLSVGLARRVKASSEGSPDEPQPLACSTKDGDSLQLLARAFDGGLSAVEAPMTSSLAGQGPVLDSQYLEAPLPLLQRLYSTDAISYLTVYLKNPDDAPALAAQLKRGMREKGLALDAYHWRDAVWNPNYVNGMGILDFSIAFVIAVVLAVAVLSVINTLTIGLAEARRALGTLRSIGYQPLQITVIYLVEVSTVILLSLPIAAGLAHGFIKGVKALAIPFLLPGLPYATTFQLEPTIFDFGSAALGLSLLVLITTSIVVWRYANAKILELLDPGE